MKIKMIIALLAMLACASVICATEFGEIKFEGSYIYVYDDNGSKIDYVSLPCNSNPSVLRRYTHSFIVACPGDSYFYSYGIEGRSIRKIDYDSNIDYAVKDCREFDAKQ